MIRLETIQVVIPIYLASADQLSIDGFYSGYSQIKSGPSQIAFQSANAYRSYREISKTFPSYRRNPIGIISNSIFNINYILDYGSIKAKIEISRKKRNGGEEKVLYSTANTKYSDADGYIIFKQQTQSITGKDLFSTTDEGTQAEDYGEYSIYGAPAFNPEIKFEWKTEGEHILIGYNLNFQSLGSSYSDEVILVILTIDVTDPIGNKKTYTEYPFEGIDVTGFNYIEIVGSVE